MSRHAATAVRRPRHSSRTSAHAAPAGRSSAPAVGVPVTAAELIARHRSALVGATAITAPSRAAAEPAGLGNRRHAARASRATFRLPSAGLAAFVRPVPIKIIARPALVAAAVIATVAGVEAAHLPSSRASAEQAASTRAASVHSSSRNPTSSPATSSAGSASGDTTTVTTAESMSISDNGDERISRDKRSATVPQVLSKPGQTVAGVWVKPNSGPMTSCFCMRWGSMHWGIDLAGPLGSPILAVGDGTVLAAGPAEGFGNWVVIQHANGDVSIYGHMRYFFVHAGEKVKAGQKIALVGDEGQSTGPHLHFEIHKGGLNGVRIDPVPWLKARGISVGPYDPNG